MAMDNAQLFSIVADLFAPTSRPDAREAWEDATSEGTWQGFLAQLRALLQDAQAWSGQGAPITRIHRSTPLQEFLTEHEVGALFAPPSWDEARAFSARHFTGGLPQSAVPVESLYVEWTADPSRGLFAHQSGLYAADTALYMRDLVASLGLVIPEALAAYPDHLSVELGVTAALLDADQADQARAFFLERTAWLTAYRMKLVQLGEEALFHLALVDALLGIRAQQAEAQGAQAGSD